MENELSLAARLGILALQLGVIIFFAKFCGDFARKLKMPSVLGELIAGIVIGPYLLGRVGIPLHGLEQGLFALPEGSNFGEHFPALYSFATIGSVVLLFCSGLETDLRMFVRYSIVGTLVGLGGVIFSFVFGDLVGIWMLNTGFMDPRCLFLGILCTATSVGITARILSEKRKIDSPEGVTILAAAVIDDVLGIICLAIVLGIVTVGGNSGDAVHWGAIGIIAVKSFGIWLGFSALGLLFARHIARWLRKYNSPTIFATLAFGMALLLAGIFEEAGLAMIVGAYVMGLSLSSTDVSFAIQPKLETLYAFLVPVFFVVMGMMVDIRVFADPDVLRMGVVYSLLAILAKIIGCALPSFFMNFNLLGAIRIGCGMIPRGEVALIIAGIGAAPMLIGGKFVTVLDSRLFGVAIIMTIATTLIAPPLLSLMLGIRHKGVRKEVKDTSIVHTAFKCPSATIASLLLDKLKERFESEGFLMTSLDKETGMMHLRCDNLSFTMTREGNDYIFESNPDEVIYIKTILYETVVDLHHTLGKLKELTKPDEIQKNIFNIAMSEAEAENEAGRRAAADRQLIEKYLPQECIVMNLKGNTKTEIFEELVDVLAVKTTAIIDKKQCLEALMEREHLFSTCMQDGLAMPHAKTDGVKNLVAAVGIHREGYKFDAMDGKPVRIFILCLCPQESAGPYIKFIAAVTKTLTQPGKIDYVVASPHPSDLINRLEGRA